MSARWYRLELGSPWVEAEPFAAIERQFREHHPAGSARLITRLELIGDLHCVAVAYLSPEAEALARSLGAVPVAAPAEG